MLDLKNLKKCDVAKLLKELHSVSSENVKTNFLVKSNLDKSSHKVKENKKYIARIKTLITEKQKENNKK